MDFTFWIRESKGGKANKHITYCFAPIRKYINYNKFYYLVELDYRPEKDGQLTFDEAIWYFDFIIKLVPYCKYRVINKTKILFIMESVGNGAAFELLCLTLARIPHEFALIAKELIKQKTDDLEHNFKQLQLCHKHVEDYTDFTAHSLTAAKDSYISKYSPNYGNDIMENPISLDQFRNNLKYQLPTVHYYLRNLQNYDEYLPTVK